MTPERKGYVNVDELMPRVSLEQAAEYYGVVLPELHRISQETRTRCFLNCGKTEPTGDRVLAIQENDPAKRWRCHDYACGGKGGNLISLCDLMKGGGDSGGRPRGERFKQIAADLQAMAAGTARADVPSAPAGVPASTREESRVNLPLADSPNERARALVNLDGKFLRDVARMPPPAAAYFRRRPFLTPEVCASWRVGYLPRDSGGDASGGTMRGKVVYAYHSAKGELLTWFGRDAGFEEKHRQWEAADRTGHQPDKFHFVKGFHRSIQLYGEHRLKGAQVAEKLTGLGLLLVEGPNDVIRLATLDVPAVALCSNTISREQAGRVARLACEIAGRIVTVLLDCDSEGEKGMKQALGYLAQVVPVRLGWASTMHGGRFSGRQPESLTETEWAEIAQFLRGNDPTADDSAAPETNPWREI